MANDVNTMKWSLVLHVKKRTLTKQSMSCILGDWQTYICICDVGAVKETKALRKRRKRLEIANRAAEEELAEISLEQQVLVELSGSKASQGTRKITASLHAEAAAAPEPPAPQTGKRSQRPINLNIADMITALEVYLQQNV